MSQALPLRGPLKTCGVNAATVQCTSCDALESCTSATPGRTLQRTRFPLLATRTSAQGLGRPKLAHTEHYHCTGPGGGP